MKKTKDANKAVKDKIGKFCEDFDFFAGVQHWDKSIVYKEGDSPLASVLVDRDYKRITLNIYPPFFKESKQSQAETLVHEFVHVLLDPLQQVTTDLLDGHLVTKRHFTSALEESTSGVTEIIVRLLQGKLAYAKKAFENYIK